MSDDKNKQAKIELVRQKMKMHGIKQWQMGQFLGIEDKTAAQQFIAQAFAGKSFTTLEKIIFWFIENKWYDLSDFSPGFISEREDLSERMARVEAELRDLKDLMVHYIQNQGKNN